MCTAEINKKNGHTIPFQNALKVELMLASSQLDRKRTIKWLKRISTI